MRFARLLVSEIKLYNESKVQQGRATRELYELLRDDIERSRQLYKERVSEGIRTVTNYFNDELVRILADGDEGAMGQPLPMAWIPRGGSESTPDSTIPLRPRRPGLLESRHTLRSVAPASRPTLAPTPPFDSGGGNQAGLGLMLRAVSP